MKLTVTGGLVSVEDGAKKPEEYAPPRKVRVELHFDVPEGEDANQHIGAVSALAAAHVGSLLTGVRPEGVKPVKATTQTSAAPGSPEPGSKAALEAEAIARMGGGTPAGDASQPAAGPKRGRAAPKVADAPSAAAQDAVQNALVQNAKAVGADPDDLTGAPAAAAADDLGDLTGEPEKPAAISDLELNNAAQKANARIKSGQRIRAVVQKYNPDPAKLPNIVLAQIPQDKRAQFLKDLEALQPE